MEIICENDRENDSSNSTDIIKYPKNFKQIGTPEGNKKIFIEDYVYSFVTNKYFKNIEFEDKDVLLEGKNYGVLLGDIKKKEDNLCVIIKGAIEITGNDKYEFSEETWTFIYDNIEKYFKGMDIVGWYINDELEKNVSSEIKKIHFDQFAGIGKTFLLIDEKADNENFYMVVHGKIKRQNGFFCFYEKNDSMQMYMQDTHPNRSVETNKVKDEAVKNFRSIYREKKEQKKHLHSNSLFYGLSGFMVVVIVAIGINLMNSYEKMKSINETMNELVKNMEQKEETAEETIAVVKLGTGLVAQKEEKGTEAVEQKVTEPEETSEIIKTDVAKTETPANKSYVVKKGDTLMSICQSELGDVQKYKEVMEINGMDNPNKLVIGQKLMLPNIK